MGFSNKSQLEEGLLEVEEKKWVTVETNVRPPLTPIRIDKMEIDDDEYPKTPTAVESRIPEMLACPGAPRKLRPSSSCRCHVGGKLFFNTPELETVFLLKPLEYK
ncbi:hypothetical protein GIB67_030796 [Kingdonia uniflora]|uniref:Uncharacterized protein n=1 Tax=Kingdonia uniflora TaxID=39325 RepID=A0A7J7L381_9MAGN|nr:hypothetical protein GIB67_030796 [Kingdonia uniflora]